MFNLSSVEQFNNFCEEKYGPQTKGETGKFLASRAQNGKNIVQRPGQTRQVNSYAFPLRIS